MEKMNAEKVVVAKERETGLVLQMTKNPKTTAQTLHEGIPCLCARIRVR
jgi:hypothetical protein